MVQSVPDSELPIALFDSGVGGLTVLRTLLSRFPNERFVYLGDTARLPYGSKSADTIERYLKQNISFLKSRGAKAIVVACNTASTVLLDQRRKNELKFDLPVYNVIEPGAEAALQASVGKRIGVLGTKATIFAQSYARALQEREPHAVVISQACPLLVPLVEEGWEDDPLTNLVIFRYLGPVLEKKIDTLILGCTHYPALRSGIARVAGNSVQLIDSATAVANAIERDFQSGRLLPSLNQTPENRLRVMATDVSVGLKEVATRLIQPHQILEIESVDLGTG